METRGLEERHLSGIGLTSVPVPGCWLHLSGLGEGCASLHLTGCSLPVARPGTWTPGPSSPLETG